MRNSKKISTGLAIASLAIGGFVYSNANSSATQLSTLQLKTIEALSKIENEETGCQWDVFKDKYGCTRHICVQVGNGYDCECGEVSMD